jgi:hypothetical protein
MAKGYLFDKLSDRADRKADKDYNLATLTGFHDSTAEQFTFNLTVVVDNVTLENNLDPNGITARQAFFEANDVTAFLANITKTLCFFEHKPQGRPAVFNVGLKVAGGKVGGPGIPVKKKAAAKKKKAYAPKKKTAPSKKKKSPAKRK